LPNGKYKGNVDENNMHLHGHGAMLYTGKFQIPNKLIHYPRLTIQKTAPNMLGHGRQMLDTVESLDFF